MEPSYPWMPSHPISRIIENTLYITVNKLQHIFFFFLILFSILVSFKKSISLCEFSVETLIIALKWLDISRFVVMPLYFLHWIRICFTMSSSPRVSHVDGSIRFRRYPWVSFVCPMRNLFSTEFSFFLKFELFHLTIKLVISRSLIVCFSQYFSHSISVVLLTRFHFYALKN